MEALGALLPGGLSAPVAAFLIAASFFTSALTAAFGVGGGVAMLALMGLFLPVAALIPVHGAVQLGSNSGRAWRLREVVRMDVAGPFIAGSAIGMVGGVFLAVQLPDSTLKILLGGFLIAVIWIPLPGIDRLSRAGLAALSIFLAVLNMLVAATGPLVSVLFAQFFPNDRKALVATHAAAMTAQHGLKIVAFAFAGFAFAPWLPLIGAMIVSGYLGTIFGTRGLDRLPEAIFRRWFRIGVTALALDLLRRGLSAL